MAGGPPELVDCERLATERATLARDYDLRTLPRLQDLLAGPQGRLHAEFVFERLETGRAGVTVAIDAAPQLVCQRCMEGFELPLQARSQIEFAQARDGGVADSPRELYETEQGSVSLRDLAEEELLLALPFAPACAAPERCGRAPGHSGRAAPAATDPETVRPFSALQDLMKKHDRT